MSHSNKGPVKTTKHPLETPMDIDDNNGKHIRRSNTDEDVITVDEIDKKTLGKIIIKKCGDEGLAENEPKQSLRKLLQDLMDYLKKEEQHVWRNAEVMIFDKNDDVYIIRSGSGGNKFILQYAGEYTKIVKTEGEKSPSSGRPNTPSRKQKPQIGNERKAEKNDVPHQYDNDSECDFEDEDVITVEQINKRTLGKIIIKKCGNEGLAANEPKQSLRRLLQNLMDDLQKEDQHVWRNAEVTIYDKNDDVHIIRSGSGGNKFVLQYVDDDTKVEIVNIKRDNKCLIM